MPDLCSFVVATKVVPAKLRIETNVRRASLPDRLRQRMAGSISISWTGATFYSLMEMRAPDAARFPQQQGRNFHASKRKGRIANDPGDTAARVSDYEQ